MAAAINDVPTPAVLKAHIAKYDICQTIDTVESLYFGYCADVGGLEVDSSRQVG